MPTKPWSAKLAEAQKAPSFKELDEGTYSFVINDAGKVGEYNGVEQISITPAVEGGPRTGSRLFHNFNFPDDNPTVLRIVFEQFQALGLGEDYFRTEPSMEAIAQALKGRRFVADVVHSKSSRDPNKTFVNLRNFKPAVAPSAGPAGPGGGPAAGPAGPGGPGAPQASPAAPAGPVFQQQPQAQQAPAPQQVAPADPWATQPAAPQQQVAASDPWANHPQAAQPQVQQQAPAQPQTQTWQPPAAPPLA